MGYFDSAKNRAAWEKKMIGLRAERKRREEEGFKPGSGREEKMDREVLKPGVTRMTFQQLEAEEAMQRQRGTDKQTPGREEFHRERQKQKEDVSLQMKSRERSM